MRRSSRLGGKTKNDDDTTFSAPSASVVMKQEVEDSDEESDRFPITNCEECTEKKDNHGTCASSGTGEGNDTVRADKLFEQGSSKKQAPWNKQKCTRGPSATVTATMGADTRRKRQRISADQRTMQDAQSFLAPPNTTPVINPLSIDHVIDCVFGFIFPGSEKNNFNIKDLCKFRCVCQAWNQAATRLIKRHCRIGVGNSLEAADSDESSNTGSSAEHDIEEELTLPILPITINLAVENIRKFVGAMKTSADIPFVMFSLREGLFSDENRHLFVQLLQVCGPSMEQLLVTMEPSTCTMSFLVPYFTLTKLKRLKVMMKHSKTDYTASAIRQFKVSDRIYPIDGINGIYLLQTLCNAAVNLDRLDIHWMPTLISWSSTFGLKDLYLPKTITKLTLDTMNTDGATVKNLLLHDNVRLSILKWSIGLPLQTLSSDDVKQCLKRHSKTLRSLYFSIWISRLHHEGTKLVEFPTMPNVEQVSLMGDGGQITPFSFPNIFPKLSSLTLYHQMLDFLGEAVPSKSVKVVRILGAPIRGDVRSTLAKAFPELETLILFPQRDLHSKEYLVSMFDLMAKLRILLSHISRSDAITESGSTTINKEEDLPNGLYMRSYRRSTYIVRIESGSTEVTRAVAEALELLDSISRNPPFTLDAAAFSYL